MNLFLWKNRDVIQYKVSILSLFKVHKLLLLKKDLSRSVVFHELLGQLMDVTFQLGLHPYTLSPI